METANSSDILPGTNFDYTSLKNGSNINPNLSAREDSTSDIITVSGRYIASIIAKNLDIEIIDFNHYNPGFDNMLATGASQVFRRAKS